MFSSIFKFRLVFAARAFAYICISAVYYLYLDSHAPLGIAWRPFHADRIFNALNNLVNNIPTGIFGLTTWDSYAYVFQRVLEGRPFSIYLVPSLPYWMHVILLSWGDWPVVIQLGPIIDYSVICIVGIFASELIASIISKLGPHNTYQLSVFWPMCAFALFLASPLSYRMMLAPWHEVPWTGLVLLFYLCCIKGKPFLGLLALFVAGLFNWIWSFLLGFFYFLSLTLGVAFENSDHARTLLPPGLKSKIRLCLMLASLFLPVIIYQSQLFLVHTFAKISTSGSTLLFRIGIDNVNNIHHGGILAILQFLGGNRLSVCLSNQFSGINQSIFQFNCILSIASWFLISGVALTAYILASYFETNYRWALLPVLWVFTSFILFFQQSAAVHLHGHSFIFSFIYALGLIYSFVRISILLKLSPRAIVLIFSPIVVGILINAIRVNLFTGKFG